MVAASEFVSVSELRTNWRSLLARVAKGERATITRRGKPVAILEPIQPAARELTHEEIVLGMRDLRKRVKPDSMSVREMVNEGRRL